MKGWLGHCGEASSAIEKGEKKGRVSRLFGVSRNTIDLWLKRREAIGSAAAMRHYRRGPAPKIDNLDAFRAFAREHGHLSQQQMADRWPEPITNRTIGTALRRIGLTRKKRLMATENAMKPNDERF